MGLKISEVVHVDEVAKRLGSLAALDWPVTVTFVRERTQRHYGILTVQHGWEDTPNSYEVVNAAHERFIQEGLF